ncbi:MAG: NAD(P)-dependent oxidoreductase [Actinomycetia bacterium]|nr:NAD(P)-dependent oxidoreductase [Actinomycetes bacterium]MCP4224179.1 NAD(P)-dependent oxidoreductase [Actinomycetes bacterium]MCP5035945.1 NAD(P)-dependent oxidoreductase [Actinomycetes bacterium]
MPHGPVIGLLHPGAMGGVIGAVLNAASNQEVLWVAEGRSRESTRRAADAGLRDAGSLAGLCGEANVIVSVCPPEAANQLASDVADTGFDGLYVDANAVSPQTARQIGTRFARFVDGGIVGPPPTKPGLTRLYLAGHEGPEVAALFDTTPVETRIVGSEAGAASAVKMCFASWTKGSSALLLAIRALAEAEGVSEALLGEWATSLPEIGARSDGVAATTGPKAWRFEGEMLEIAATFTAAGLPGEFHQGAADIYHRLAPLKGSTAPSLEEALDLLLSRS